MLAFLRRFVPAAVRGGDVVDQDAYQDALALFLDTEPMSPQGAERLQAAGQIRTEEPETRTLSPGLRSVSAELHHLYFLLVTESRQPATSTRRLRTCLRSG